MDNFDKIIKGKLSDTEVPYNEAHWEEMEELLDNRPSTSGSSSPDYIKIIGAAAAAITIIAVTFYFTQQDPGSSADTEGAPHQQTENTIIDNKKDNDSPSSYLSESKEKETSNSRPETNEKVAEKNGIPETDEKNSTSQQDNSSSLPDEREEGISIDNKNTSPVQNENLNTSPYQPDLSFTCSSDKVCAGKEIRLKVESPDPETEYKWDIGNGTLLYGKSTSFSYGESGNYTITLLAKTENETFSNSKENLIRVFPAPDADFEYSENKELTLKDPYMSFKAENDKLKSYEWDFGDNSESDKINPEHIYNKKGWYNVKLITTNTYGCSDTAYNNVFVHKSFDLTEYTPTAFNPGSNIPENKFFMPRALEVSNVEFEMIIYDNAQNIVYSTGDPNEPWNGRINNSGNIIPGDYSWKVITVDKKGIEHTHIGTVKLLKK